MTRNMERLQPAGAYNIYCKEIFVLQAPSFKLYWTEMLNSSWNTVGFLDHIVGELDHLVEMDFCWMPSSYVVHGGFLKVG